MQEFSSFFKTKTHDGLGFARHYLHGLLQGKRDAKNMERMAESVEGFSYHATQQFLSHSPWDARALMDASAKEADGLLGGSPHSYLTIDDSASEKKGRESVGVARQYNGRLGKVDNCQVAVCTSLANGTHSTLVDMRLYLPKEWAEDPARCDKAGVPAHQQVLRTKSDLALQSIRHCRELGLRFSSIGMDSGYGSIPGFLEALDELGERFVAEVHCNQRVWLECPWPHQQGQRAGSKLKHPKPSAQAQQVDQWAQSQAESAWRRLKVRESDQGWIEVRYLAQRVWTMHEGKESMRWLLVWENPHEDQARRHYALSNAPADFDERRLVQQGAQRSTIEQNFRDAKKEVGMADYQVRGWLAWHHHMSLVLLAMLFVLREKIHHPMPKDTPTLSAGDIVFVLEHYLPKRGFGAANKEEIARMLTKRRRQRQEDQTRRKRQTALERPPLWPDEELS
jgi:SRSO17 transposase